MAAGEALDPFEGEEKLGALVALVLLVGAFQMVFGLLRLGRLIRFVSIAVMTGFITGIALLIMFGSVSDITGFSSDQPNHLLRLAHTAMNWRILDPPDRRPRYRDRRPDPRLPAHARTEVRVDPRAGCDDGLAVVMAQVAGESTAVLVGDIATIPRSLPYPVLPDLAQLPAIALPAFAIAIIGLIQGAGVGQSYPNPDGSFPDTSRDFVGQGAANLAAGAFSAIPCGGSMSGTAVNVQAGARSRWANIFAGAFVVLIVLLLVDLVKLVPMAALGGLLLVVGFQNIQPESIRAVWATGRPARAAMVATFVATLFLPLQFAILIGVALSFLLQILRMSNRIEVREFELVDGGFPIERPAPLRARARRGSGAAHPRLALLCFRAGAGAATSRGGERTGHRRLSLSCAMSTTSVAR